MNSKKNMICVKCGGNMVKGEVNTIIPVWGEEISKPPRATYQKPYHPVYAHICEECGSMEFYTTPEKDR